MFTSAVGTELDAHNCGGVSEGRQGGRPGSCSVDAPGAAPQLRFVLSDAGTSLEDIARLCGHSGTAVTEQVYPHQIRPVMVEGAVAMDRIFASWTEKS